MWRNCLTVNQMRCYLIWCAATAKCQWHYKTENFYSPTENWVFASHRFIFSDCLVAVGVYFSHATFVERRCLSCLSIRSGDRSANHKKSRNIYLFSFVVFFLFDDDYYFFFVLFFFCRFICFFAHVGCETVHAAPTDKLSMVADYYLSSNENYYLHR